MIASLLRKFLALFARPSWPIWRVDKQPWRTVSYHIVRIHLAEVNNLSLDRYWR